MGIGGIGEQRDTVGNQKGPLLRKLENLSLRHSFRQANKVVDFLTRQGSRLTNSNRANILSSPLNALAKQLKDDQDRVVSIKNQDSYNLNIKKKHVLHIKVSMMTDEITEQLKKFILTEEENDSVEIAVQDIVSSMEHYESYESRAEVRKETNNNLNLKVDNMLVDKMLEANEIVYGNLKQISIGDKTMLGYNRRYGSKRILFVIEDGSGQHL
ncbi:hypothetical protein HAX54_041557 [Datura stramonium]|uniref:Uncharacterized protein n=1 Tax=Datura stramonium TaxID=4076 RepID=A0ABS8RP11_DATST|nr:hypothetical protein [Datura stramonium]